MLRLKEDLLTKVGSMKEENCTQDEILKVLAEYREGQRELVERRLAEKERASRKLQERLARKKILKVSDSTNYKKNSSKPDAPQDHITKLEVFLK